MPLSLSLRRLWTLDKFAYSLRVFIAFSGALLFSGLAGDVALVIPLFLGIIASALSETDDSWQGRLQALVVTLLCFASASFVVQWLFPWPWLFAAGLAVSTFTLIMLGAIGQRYATIASGTLILSIYSMINIEQHGGVDEDVAARQLLLLAGAAWYGAISVVWCALFSRQPVKQSMARVYKALGEFLILKSALFEPVRGVDVEARRVALARQNGKVVDALNQAKEMIFRRLEGQRGSRKLNRYLQIYFIAQDIHERASSTHYPYSALTDAFFHHDVLFRCQRLLDQQGRACRQLAKSLLLNRPFSHEQSEQALADLRASIDNLSERGKPEWRPLIRPLNALADNLSTLEAQIASVHNPDTGSERRDSALYDRSPSSLLEAWKRVRLNFTLGSPTFRHAVRLTTALVAGYGLLQWLDPQQGFWILLTTLFVCRPNFATTRRFLSQRILGTVLGLIAGWASISLFPQPLIQSMIAVAAGVSFFANREKHYVIATASITLLVLCSFNQVGDGFDLIWPRLFDTLIGSLIAGLAVFFILPDWQSRRLYREAAKVLTNHRRYLDEIVHQYEEGKQDDLAYRLARRNAHNADAALSTLLTNMLHEPGHYRKQDADNGLRFLVLSNTLLSHLSALGAHRHRLAEDEDDAAFVPLAKRISALLEQLAEQLDKRLPVEPLTAPANELLSQLEEQSGTAEEKAVTLYRPIQSQLRLIASQLGPLSDAANRLTSPSAEKLHEPNAAV
ncbi:TIGR01666 family membrane protein [Vreelandella aquamarina]|jgi:YccS/YhfK family integral membrane protein|uniref:TIGR01666 family membrane protein n=1 Tax=Vreelandella aquamarina TaxID=77097 RepID=A0A6F8XF33_9GAMM|nr:MULTISPECIES: YccS family putative transporter [Halomonas]MCP1302374.1 YccS family putative transporter [Halomonas sp. R1t8]MCP1329914.1 YccS family putative transporter [Halomonas sp. R1t4]MDC8443906.1 TIGR01666 family membrane protein [Halomonas aquamarina]TKJ10931.1 TIGR01666 family membrane protein [Halomonas sp. 15WGF]BCB71980.1 TIGR01666 family membrane protein [Halomonas meridiana]